MNSLIAQVLGEADLVHRIEPTTPLDLSDPNSYDVDERMVQSALAQSKERFVRERLEGFTSKGNGAFIPPVSLEVALSKWEKVKDRFEQMLRNDPEVMDRLYLRWPKKQPPFREKYSYGHEGD